MISSDEEPMEVDGGPSSPPTANTAGGAQVMEVLSGDGDAMDLDEPGPSTAPTNTAGVTLTKGLVRIPPTNVSVVISMSSSGPIFKKAYDFKLNPVPGKHAESKCQQLAVYESFTIISFLATSCYSSSFKFHFISPNEILIPFRAPVLILDS